MNTAVAAALIVVLVTGGHIFSTVFLPTKMHAAREFGHRLYFPAVFYACFSLAVASLLVFPGLLQSAKLSGDYAPDALYRRIVTNDLLLLRVITLAFLVSVLLPFLLNLCIRILDALVEHLVGEPWIKLFLVRSAIAGNDLEKLIFRAQRSSIPLLVPLSSRKFYVGWIVDGPNPQVERKNLKVLPILSGARGENFQNLQFTTNYHAVFEDLYENRSDSEINIADFEVVLPVEKIVSAHLFDLTVYERFQKETDLGL